MTVIAIPKVTFVIGDAREDLVRLVDLSADSLRPIYGPEDANGERPFVGVIRPNTQRADTVNYIERLSSMLDFADANMPPEEP